MNKGIIFLILYVSLFAIETICSFIIVLLYFSFEAFDLKGSFDSAVLWNFWRVLFYGLPYVILYLLLFKYVINIKLNRPLLFSLFNLSVYVALSVLSGVIFGKNVPLPAEGIMFWITCVSIILSTIILWQKPYFKKLMVSL